MKANERIRRNRLKPKVKEALFNWFVFLYAVSIYLTAFISYPLVLGTFFAVPLSLIGLALSPFAAILRYFVHKDIPMTTRPSIIILAIFYGLSLLFVSSYTSYTYVNGFVTRRRLTLRRWEILTINTVIVLFIESLTWILQFFSFSKKLTLVFICFYQFYGDFNVFENRRYSLATKKKLKNYFEQGNSLQLVVINEIGYNVAAYY